MYPKIFLAIDNCFASKRWTTPEQWAQIIADLGVQYVECSADTELDPLFMGTAYLHDWPEAVVAATEKTGVRPCSLYSGHGTYSTLGLAHTDSRVRKNMMERWFKPLIEVAGQLGSQLGFFAHCFNESILQDPAEYARYHAILEDELAELNAYAEEKKCGWLALEQMYSPNQVPWTIHGTADLLQRVSKQSGRPFYFTEDVGHHHNKFVMPTAEDIQAGVAQQNSSLWLGTQIAHDTYDKAAAARHITEDQLNLILSEIQRMPHLFSSTEDSDCYTWLRALGCYAPIIHLQQTDGLSSGHKPFTPENNRWGKINAPALLNAIKDAYDRPLDSQLPPRVDKIYLTLELFSGTSQNYREILKDYQKSVDYWRKFIPIDGLTVDQLLSLLDHE